MKIRTRFAPSPTGNLHIGGIRTALYCYAFAKKNGGEFVLRIEDTDRERFVEGSIEEIVELLDIYKLSPNLKLSGSQLSEVNLKKSDSELTSPDWILKADELSSVNDDDYSDVFVQSLRIPLYQKYALKLIDYGFAYPCFCSKERLAELRKGQEESGQRAKYDGACRHNTIESTKERIENGEEYVIRMNVDAYSKKKSLTEVEYDDHVMGHMKFPLDEVDDQVIMKSNGIPTYHLAVVVDDHLMEITHPFRAAEWIPSTPKQILLYDMLEWEMPKFAHLTAILDPKTGGKLSKRNGSVAAMEFLEQGYLPEAINNFLMLLGWSSPEQRVHGESEREFYSLTDFVELFDIKDLNKSNPVFNREKLEWFNQKYIGNLSPDDLTVKFGNWMKDYGEKSDKVELINSMKDVISEKGPDHLERILVLIQERVKVLSDIPELIKAFYFQPEAESVKKEIKDSKQTKQLTDDQLNTIINEFKSELSKQNSLEDWGHESWEKFVRDMADSLEIKAGQAFMTLRIVTLGTPFSPPLFEAMEVLGKEEVEGRLSI